MNLCAVQRDGNADQTAGNLFSAEEKALIGGYLEDLSSFQSSSGGQLFTTQQVQNFGKEMDEWIFAPRKDGGAGVKFNESVTDTDTEAGTNTIGFVKSACDAHEYQKGMDKYKQVLISTFINRQNSLGNTALHLAVMHGRLPIIDWLLHHHASPSMRILNINKLTAFTVAARSGDVSTMSHMMNHEKKTVWQYGSVAMTLTDLEQIDTFRILPEKDAEVSPNSVQRLFLKCDTKTLLKTQDTSEKPEARVTREKAKEKMFSRLARTAQGRFLHQRLHQNPKYLSALEVVVKHEKGAFITGRSDLDNLDSAAMFSGEMSAGDGELYCVVSQKENMQIPH
jgi:hypothetical protein